MRKLMARLATSLVLLASAAHGQTPPVITDGSDPAVADQTILFVPEGVVSCADGPLHSTASDDFAPTLWGTTFNTLPVGQRIEQATWAFGVSDAGHPQSIRPVIDDAALRPTAVIDAQVQASFASWTFPRQARKDCRLTLRYTPTPIATADTDILIRFYALARPGRPIREAVERRLRRPGDDCDRPPPLKNLAYPNFLLDRPRPGSRSWAGVRWDVAADGTTTAIETIGSSGDTVLDSEVRRAMAETSFQSGPSKGCLYSYWRDGPNLPAPPMNRDAPEDPLATCTEAVAGRFTPGPLVYPPALQDRGIEGWARIRFDVASWGAIGNVAIVEAEPVATFGEPAMRIVMSGRATPSFEAATRCVVPIVFRIPEADQPGGARLPGTGPGPGTAPRPPAPF